jgi:hypothetical protein
MNGVRNAARVVATSAYLRFEASGVKAQILADRKVSDNLCLGLSTAAPHHTFGLAVGDTLQTASAFGPQVAVESG